MLILFVNFTHGSKYLMFHLSFLYCAHKKNLVAANYSKDFCQNVSDMISVVQVM